MQQSSADSLQMRNTGFSLNYLFHTEANIVFYLFLNFKQKWLLSLVFV